MKLTKLFSILLVLVLAMTVVGVAYPQDDPEDPDAEAEVEKYCTEEIRDANLEKDIYIPIISKGFQHQFWQAVKSGAEMAAEDCGVTITFEGPPTESDVAEQMDMLQVALDKEPDALVFAALDSVAATPLLELAEDDGIPVIAFDSGVDSDIPLTTAATNNVAAAALAADKMAELIDFEGQVAVIAHDQTSRTGIDRVDGFVSRMEEEYPDIEVVDVQYGGDHLESSNLANAIILAHPDLKGFFGANEGSIIGVLNAVTELGMEGEIVVIGYDSGIQQMDAIRSGVEVGAITQDPIGIGYRSVEAAVMALAGEELEEEIDTGFHWYDADTIDSEDILPLLYE